jgi:hypothetical protein
MTIPFTVTSQPESTRSSAEGDEQKYDNGDSGGRLHAGATIVAAQKLDASYSLKIDVRIPATPTFCIVCRKSGTRQMPLPAAGFVA